MTDRSRTSKRDNSQNNIKTHLLICNAPSEAIQGGQSVPDQESHRHVATDTMDGRVKYVDVNDYAQVFSNGTKFAEIYLMDKKDDSGQALKMFVMELSVPEELTFDGIKEKNCRNFCLLYYFLNLIFSQYPLYSLAQDKTTIPMVMTDIIISNEQRGKLACPITVYF